MLDRDEELKLLAFLASLAGLLGIVVSVSNFQIGSASSTTVGAYFSVIRIVFMFTAAIAYLSALADRDVKEINQAVLGFFSTLLGLVVGAAVASQYPSDYAFAGFWLTGFIFSVIFYLALQRWNMNLKWQLEPNNPP
jgi:uncharacterized membrane protein HdeD (DUF308 family)